MCTRKENEMIKLRVSSLLHISCTHLLELNLLKIIDTKSTFCNLLPVLMFFIGVYLNFPLVE